MFWSKRRIYADAAASTPISRQAKKELVRVLDVYGNPGALHQEALAAKKELEHARKIIADAIGAHADEIIFTASGTEANNLAIQGFLAPQLRLGAKLSAITSIVEHQSVLAPLQALERESLVLSVVDVQPDGLIFSSSVAEAIRPDTALASIQLINSEMGAVQPIHALAKELRRAKQKIYFHVDGSQAPLWTDIKVESLGVDMLTLDAQKVLGPKGIGCLYVKRGVPLDPVIWGGGQERGKRAGTENAASAAAFAVALADAQYGAIKRAKKIAKIRDFLWEEIKKALPDVVLHGPPLTGGDASRQTRVANNLNFSIPGLDAQMAVIAMDAEGIAISARSACSTEDEEPSYVIKALGVSDKVAKEAIRITLLPDASYSQARRIAAALVSVAGRYRKL